MATCVLQTDHNDRCVHYHVAWPPSARPLRTHVNLVELEAVFQALLHFLPELQENCVIVRTDSSTVVSYINHKGGVCSPPLFRKAWGLLLWAQAQGLTVRSVHLSGVDNAAATLLSRGGLRPGEWRLHLEVVQGIWARFREAWVNLFVSLETTHCPMWFSMVGHIGTLGVDALANRWPPGPSVMLPPFPLGLVKVKQKQSKALLVTPRLVTPIMDARSGGPACKIHLVSPRVTGHALQGSGATVALKSGDVVEVVVVVIYFSLY